MKVRLPVLIKDPDVARYKGVPYYEEISFTDDFFLDGPVSRRVAVVDFDEKGQLVPGTRFEADHYVINADEHDPNVFSNWNFLRAAVFGGVYKALDMFEDEDTLGRKVRWAFPGPQLLIVPRAGEWANAYYERESRSLQLFFVTEADGRRVYTCQSQDIIGHETAHAIIDGVAPDLYDASTPESLAIHEALADITTVLLAFKSRKLSGRVLQQTGGKIDSSTAFTQIAPQFGALVSKDHGPLRELNNKWTLRSKELDLTEPHDLSEVLSGALYRVAVRLHESLKGAPEAPKPDVAVRAEMAQWDRGVATQELAPLAEANSPGKALFLAGERVKRLALRGLDYLPPGDASFADYGKAIWASDEVSHVKSDSQRFWLAEEFLARKIISSKGDLDTHTNFESKHLKDVSLEDLRDSDWAAYTFVGKKRSWLGIPAGVPFQVHPRLHVKKKAYHRTGEETHNEELILKIGWTATEPADVGRGLPRKRRYRRGTTLAIDWKTKKVRALLTSGGDENQRVRRDDFFRSLVGQGKAALGDAALAPNGMPLRSVIPAEMTGGTIRLRGAARLLHFRGAR